MIIKENVTNELIINKSKFITFLFKITDKQQFIFYLNQLKEQYKDANHICYAYIINNEQRFNDDKEPTGTAGMPILEVLKKNDLNYIACFVIRYFGGIKLGAGGLIRAYSNSCSLCLKKASIIPFVKLIKIKLAITYQEQSKIEKIISNEEILDQIFSDKINYILLISEEKLNKLNELNIKYDIIN